MSVDVIADFLTIIRNGLIVRKRLVNVPSSKLKVNIAEVLKAEGYIRDYEINDSKVDAGKVLTLHLKYVKGESVIHELKRISKPSRRYYENSTKLTSVIGGLGISILSTSSGVITDLKARQLGVGGEVLCHIW